MRVKPQAWFLHSVLVLAAAAVIGTPAWADPPRWTFSDIGAVFNTAEAIWPYGVNDLGQVAGSGKQAFFLGAPEGAFVTQPNSMVNWSPRPGNPGLFVDQIVNGTFNNDPPSASPDNLLRPRPTAVNSSAVTTGVGHSYPHAMTFLGTYNLTTAIGPANTGEVGTGYAINDANVVAGVKSIPAGRLHAIRISGGVTTDLGTFRTLPPTANNDRSEAYGINQAGEVVGFATTDVFVPGIGTNESHAFRWSEGGGLVDLGTAGGPVSIAYDISNNGAVAGYAYDPGYAQVAVVWSPANVLSVIPNGAQTYPRIARWINDAGWVVGTAHIVPTGAGYFFHENGQTYDMATLIDDDGTHWANLVFTDMNQNGQIVGYGTNDNTPAGARRVFLLTPGGPTATALSLVDAQASAERVTLRWHSAEHALSASVERREVDGAWSYRADVSSDGSGMLEYEDTEIVPGRRYGYRVAIQGSGPPEYLGETWVDVPGGSMLAIHGFRPNPSRGAPMVSFSLPEAGPARLEILDIQGRRVLSNDWASLQAGAHTVSLLAQGGLRPGVFVLRLSFGGRTVTANGVVIDH